MKGFCRLIDHMGDDKRIVDAARISFDNFGEKISDFREEQLIDYLIRNDHTSPFEQVVFVFHIKMPIFLARQHVRHRTARLNEMSGRYVELRDEYFLPEQYRNQSKDKKQSSEGVSVYSRRARELAQDTSSNAFKRYRSMVENGVAKEQARIHLPLGTYTAMIWQIDLSNLLKYLSLRLHPHAQVEIQEYAQLMLKAIEPIVPKAVEAWKRHKLHGVSLSREEVDYFIRLIEGAGSEIAHVEPQDRETRILVDKLLAAKAMRGL